MLFLPKQNTKHTYTCIQNIQNQMHFQNTRLLRSRLGFSFTSYLLDCPRPMNWTHTALCGHKDVAITRTTFIMLYTGLSRYCPVSSKSRSVSNQPKNILNNWTPGEIVPEHNSLSLTSALVTPRVLAITESRARWRKWKHVLDVRFYYYKCIKKTPGPGLLLFS